MNYPATLKSEIAASRGQAVGIKLTYAGDGLTKA
jgi:hypothetical protein